MAEGIDELFGSFAVLIRSHAEVVKFHVKQFVVSGDGSLNIEFGVIELISSEFFDICQNFILFLPFKVDSIHFSQDFLGCSSVVLSLCDHYPRGMVLPYSFIFLVSFFFR